MPPCVVGEELFQAAREQAATRAIQRLLKGRAPSTISPAVLKNGTPILYFYKSTKASEPIEWRPGTVISADPHRVKIRNKSGAYSFVAYEDLRLRPQSALTRQLMDGTLESVLEDESLNIPIDDTGALSIESSDDSAADQGDDEDSESSTEHLVVQGTDEEEMHIAPALSAGLFDDGAIEMHDEPPPPSPRMEAGRRDLQDHIDDIASAADPSGRELESEKQRLLQVIRQRIGNK